ncbi:polysaccharide deacetylase family protein [Dyella tabacisoli]|uniref:Polysaccharide deacetylase family protein n=1 Tax=Dyella tabacisoli TaxID=2282381 RepID=A0A369UPD7_9GAMM|nr:polysaccharide deacetylase family protein [Dyella tabacisoli]RDD82337.1 polysaccharide deacetylase family protein [Dyella tabacisoli]
MSSLLLSFAAHAAGPQAVAAPERDLWPDSLGSNAGFDRASRAELLVFGHVLAESESIDAATLATRLKIKQVDEASVARLRNQWWQRLAVNYQAAAAGCAAKEPFCLPVHDLGGFRKAATAFAGAGDARYAPWYDNALKFHRTYLDELLRLAALFPRTNSEVDVFSPREITGSDWPDRHFQLSFDDGPTAIGGGTDRLLDMLREHQLHAVFFVLGERLQPRLEAGGRDAMAQAYKGMCVGSHGWEHKSHSSWPQWQDSVSRSTALIRTQLPEVQTPLFRPPYGQRRADSGAFFDAQGLRVALWNIDSQDWSSKVDADQVSQRVLTLMLLWRRGVILFHDVHNKAQQAVPWLLQQTRDSGVVWADCHELAG